MHTSNDEFEWDPEKAETNRQKHGISFLDAQDVFLDVQAISVRNTLPFEERFLLIGTDNRGRLLVVVYVWRKDKIRIISARTATSSEARQYQG